jgi:predicted small lipoprotein YifL
MRKARHLRPILKAIIASFVAFSLSACGTVGPETVPRDRIDYATAIGDSWKQQTLLNIVKLRYGDLPVFLDVQQVIAGYQFNSTATAGFNASNTTFENPSPSFLTLGGSVLLQGSYRDSPTVIYTPTVGSDFLTRLMTPIPPSAVMFLLQAGYAADGVMTLTLDSINGINNKSNRRVHMGRNADPRFARLGQLIREMQAAGALEIRIKQPTGANETSVIVFKPRQDDPATEAKRKEIAEILGLAPDLQDIEVFYGGSSGKSDEIAMQTRSMLQVMIELGFDIPLPSADVDQGRAWPSPEGSSEGNEERPMLRIASGEMRPNDAYIAVPYHGRWFWIPDTDIASKYAFSFVMLLFSVSDKGAQGAAPVVTVPANN